MDIEKNYQLFKKYLETYAKDAGGLEYFLEWLDTTDLKTAPASTKYHLCCEGGLVQHSLNVFKQLVKILKAEYPDRTEVNKQGEEMVFSTLPTSKETIAIVALLHDISKVNYYMQYTKNVRNPETGKWSEVVVYGVRDDEDKYFYGTPAENSVEILSKFFPLTEEERIAIRYQMGCMDSTDAREQARVWSAYKRFPLALYLHMADMAATCIDDNELYACEA